jgi:hypothetical protein
MEYFVLVDKNEKILNYIIGDTIIYYSMVENMSKTVLIFDETLYNDMIKNDSILFDEITEQDIILSELSKREIRIVENTIDVISITDWETELKKVEQCPQRQDSMIDQMKDLWQIANKFGFYDAADHIRTICKF